MNLQEHRLSPTGILITDQHIGTAEAICVTCLDDLQLSTVEASEMGKPNDLVQGTLDVLILRTIALEPKHGWAIAKRIQQVSHDVLQVQQGSLYPALHRLEHQGWISAEWRQTESGRQAKVYALTRAGRSHLEREKAQWERLSGAIDLVLKKA